nr:cholinesterase-like [Lytechinus pictus]
MDFFILIFLFGSVSIIETLAHPLVKLAEGTIEGNTTHFDHFGIRKTVNIYLGVPFAEPPVRFSPPTPKASWQHILDTKTFKPACMQPIYNNYPIVDEDCLYLNVYTPSPKPNNAAVLVYIHGGTFVTGSAMTYMYYGVPLVAVGDVIVVTVNYRVGIFSRFSTRGEEARGNFGMLDQVEALRWVQRNIAGME